MEDHKQESWAIEENAERREVLNDKIEYARSVVDGGRSVNNFYPKGCV